MVSVINVVNIVIATLILAIGITFFAVFTGLSLLAGCFTFLMEFKHIPFVVSNFGFMTNFLGRGCFYIYFSAFAVPLATATTWTWLWVAFPIPIGVTGIVFILLHFLKFPFSEPILGGSLDFKANYQAIDEPEHQPQPNPITI